MLNDHLGLQKVTLDGIEYTIFPSLFKPIQELRPSQRNPPFADETVRYESCLYRYRGDPVILSDRVSCILGAAHLIGRTYTHWFVIRQAARFICYIDTQYSGISKVCITLLDAKALDAKPISNKRMERVLKIEKFL